MSVTSDALAEAYAAVLAAPADDAPRRAFAALLEASPLRGAAAHARFITLQLDLAAANVPRGAEDQETWERTVEACHLLEDSGRLPLSFGPAGLFKFRPVEGGAIDVEYEDLGKANPTVRYHRGFVESVSLPLALLVQSPCDACGGSGTRARHGYARGGIGAGYHPTRLRCRECAGAGLSRDLAALLGRREPLVRVGVLDRRPSRWADDGETWVWERDMFDIPSDDRGWGYLDDTKEDVLPPAVFDGMAGEPGGHYFVVGKISNRRYPTALAAFQALSDRLLALYAARTADLPGGAG